MKLVFQLKRMVELLIPLFVVVKELPTESSNLFQNQQSLDNVAFQGCFQVTALMKRGRKWQVLPTVFPDALHPAFLNAKVSRRVENLCACEVHIFLGLPNHSCSHESCVICVYENFSTCSMASCTQMMYEYNVSLDQVH